MLSRIIKFTKDGYTVHRPPTDETGNRTPFIYHNPSRTLYMGGPDDNHPDIESYYDLEPFGDHTQGYIGYGGSWHPGVNFYYHRPRNWQEISQALGEAGYNVGDEPARKLYDENEKDLNNLNADDIWE